MGQTTDIEYSDSTCNAVPGCEGCELWNPRKGVRRCYAGRLTEDYAGAKGWPERFEQPLLIPQRILDACRWRDLTGTPRAGSPWMDDLPRVIFVNDMGESYQSVMDRPEYIHGLMVKARDAGNGTLAHQIAEALLAIEDGGHWMDPWIPHMEAAPHVWYILTKRPARMVSAFRRLGRVPANFWLNTSVTSTATHRRAVKILEIRDFAPDATLGVSYEPADDPWIPPEGLSWVIIGTESGPNARPLELSWVDDVLAANTFSGTRTFLKQLPFPNSGKKGGDWSGWPAFYKVREMPAWAERGQVSLFGATA